MPLLVNDTLRIHPILRRYPSTPQEWDRFIKILNEQTVSATAVPPGGGSWTTTTAFSSTDADTVAWGAGTLTTAAGGSYSIGASNTGNMVARTYIFFDADVSTTAYQTTTTAANAVGENRILVAVAENTSTEAFFQVFGGIGGTLLTANEIAANTITANEIAATTITGTQISSLSISGKTLTADTGTVGGWTLAASELSSGNVIIDATDETIKIGSATAPLTGEGIYVGLDGASDYDFRAGDPAGDYIHWDGSAGALTIIGKTTLSNTAGSFTPSYTGFSTAPTGDWLYLDLGAIVIMWPGASGYAQGTSNANTFTVTNVPSAIQSNGTFILVSAINNSLGIIAAANFSGATITFVPYDSADHAGTWPSTSTANVRTVAAGWTASGNKAITQNAVMIYPKV